MMQLRNDQIAQPSGLFRNWQKGDFLGSGSFGTVYEGLNEYGFFFAVKEISSLDQGSHGTPTIVQLEQEISLLSQFQHENIVRYYGTQVDDEKLYIFLELVPRGSVAKLYQIHGLTNSEVSTYTRQILSGLNYLHERKVVHRDIKCANVLIDASGCVKLADFGLTMTTTLDNVISYKGSPYFMAPEVVKNKGYGLAADIWSLGCTVLEMLTCKIPYSHFEVVCMMFTSLYLVCLKTFTSKLVIIGKVRVDPKHFSNFFLINISCVKYDYINRIHSVKIFISNIRNTF